MGREEEISLSRQPKRLSIRVLHFPDRMTEPLLENVSYKKPWHPRQGLDILVDCIAGAGELDVGLYSAGIALRRMTRILIVERGMI